MISDAQAPQEVSKSTFQIESSAEDQSNNRPKDSKTGCRCLRTSETVGYYHCGFGRLVIFSTMLYLSTAIVLLASEDAGCEESDDDDGKACDKPVMGGLRPSSLLALINVTCSFLSACLMPILGAVVDHSPYRRQVGLWSSVLLVLVNIAQTAIGPDTWFAMTIMSVFSTVFYISVLTVQLAYLPELKTDEQKVLTIAGKSRAFELAGTLFLLIFAAIVARGIINNHDKNNDSDWNDAKQAVVTARVSQILGVLCGGPSVVLCWVYCLGNRPSLHNTKVESASSCNYIAQLWYIGASGLYSTMKFLRQDYPNVVNYLWAFAFWEAASSGLTALSTSFLIFELGFNSQQVVIFFLIVIFAAIPSSVASKNISIKYGLHRSLKACLVYSVCVFTCFAFLCRTPPVAYFFAALFGLQSGWINPVQRFAFTNIIPGGRETELFGLFSFASQALGWIPALIFIIINQGLGGNLRLALLCPISFYALGLLIIVLSVNFEEAAAAVAVTLNKRTGPAFKSMKNAQKMENDGL